MTTRKGLVCSVFKNPLYKGCSNGGISSRVDQVVLIGPGVPEIFEPTDDCPAVKLVRRDIGSKEYLHAESIEEWERENLIGPMAGGSYIYTSDSRFPNPYPISLHDRYESQKMYDSLTR
jgi:hypothetical protein